MMLDWLLGRVETRDNIVRLPSLTIDIDTVKDIHRMMAAETARAVAAARANGPSFDGSAAEHEVQELREYEQRIADAQSLAPRLELSPVEMNAASSVEILAFDQLERISATDAQRLSLVGASVIVDFRLGSPTVIANTPLFGREVVQVLTKNGRRRVLWVRQVWLLPLIAAATLLGLWIWMLVAGNQPIEVLIFAAMTVVVSLAAAIAAAVHLVRRYQDWSPGHRILRVTRAQTRERWLNARVNIIVGVIGALIGAAVTIGTTYLITKP